MTAATITVTAPNGPPSSPAEPDSVHETAADTQAAKETIGKLVANAQRLASELSALAARVTELVPQEQAEQPPSDIDDDEEIEVSAEQLAGLKESIEALNEAVGNLAAGEAEDDEEESDDSEEESAVESVTSPKPACLPQPGDVLWICASCMEATKPFEMAFRVRVRKVRDLHEKPLKLSEYHSRWHTTPFDRFQIDGEIVSEGSSKGRKLTFWIPGPHAAEWPTLQVVSWPIEDGQITPFGPAFESDSEFCRSTLTMAARKLIEQGSGSFYRIMPAVPQAKGGVS